MENCKRADQFLCNFILYSITTLITCFFFSYPFWFPSMKLLLFSLPDNISFLFNAKCFFLVGNFIVFILIGQSKLAPSSHSSPASDIYDEYIARSRSCHKVFAKGKEEDGFMRSMNNIEEKKHRNYNIKNKYYEEKKNEVRGGSEIARSKKTKGEKEDRLIIPREELNKRVEAFIARVNKQRVLDAELADHMY